MMVTRALIAVNRDAEKLNSAFSDVIRDLVRHVFVNPNKDAQISAIRVLLRQFDRPCSKSNISGEREAAIVEPFDLNRAFARVCSLFRGRDDKSIFQLRTILEPPERHQLRYRSAYALYQTMLDLVSSPESFPLFKLPGYECSGVDWIYEDMEIRHLSLTGKGVITSNSFFILPVYYGSLPICVLILPSIRSFTRPATNSDVYQSIFLNLHDQIRLLFTHDFLKNRILSPFLARALDGLMLKPDCTEEGAKIQPVGPVSDVVELSLNVIRKRLDGATSWNAEFEPNHVLLGGVLGKPWKSWLLTIPSIPIKELDRTKSENRILIDLFREEAKRALMDHELRLSYWFEQGGFFEDSDDGGHDYWLCKKRLRHMFLIAGYPSIPVISAIPDDRWLSGVVNWLNELQKSESPAVCGYFARSHKHFLFEWMTCQFQLLITAKNNCPNASKGCDTNGDDGNCSRQEVFRNLKVVFCKSFANKGERVRFGLRRLLCLLDAACGRDIRVSLATPECPDFSREGSYYRPIESKYFSKNDPSMHLAEFVYALRCLGVDSGSPTGILQGVQVTLSKVTGGVQCNIVVSVVLELSEEMGGSQCDRARLAFEKVKVFATQTNIFGSKQFTFSFSVKVKDLGVNNYQGIEFKPTK